MRSCDPTPRILDSYSHYCDCSVTEKDRGKQTLHTTHRLMHYSHSTIHYSTFYVKSRESRYLENGTFDHRNEKTKTLCNTKYPPKPGKTHFRNPFWPFENGFSAITTYKNIFFSKSPNGPISNFFLVTGEVMKILEQPSDLPVLFIFVGVASSA